eukprot:Protomagalhaensia_sp_Gyna_25__3422@NODE_308_length_3960_cov_111_493497_g239_i0_p2_GENE_NODE_308_length_3960_cov_111_493497_g239_i0NODE_308_length_3960_cov_111_493497_g239_i0_p2_ORF_typecomplete_len262_score39_43_NODE_308_length_3960_cov_111_493497_g239_i08721657
MLRWLWIALAVANGWESAFLTSEAPFQIESTEAPFQIESTDDVTVNCNKSDCVDACVSAGCETVESGIALGFCLRELSSSCSVQLTVSRSNISPIRVCSLGGARGWAFDLPFATPNTTSAVFIIQLNAALFNQTCNDFEMTYGFISPVEWFTCGITNNTVVPIPEIYGSPHVIFSLSNSGQNQDRFVQLRTPCALEIQPTGNVEILYHFETGFFPGYLDTNGTTTTTTAPSAEEVPGDSSRVSLFWTLSKKLFFLFFFLVL